MPARPKKSAGASVVRLTEATGISPRSWDAAVVAAVKASEVKDPVGVEISRMWAEYARGRLTRYHVTVRVAYRQALKAETRR